MSNLIVQGEEFKALKEQATMAVKSGFLPQSIKTPEQAIIIGLKSRELGLPLMAGFSLINVINGKPSVSAEGMMALIYKNFPDSKIQFQKMTNDECVIVAARHKNNDPSVFRFTIQDAAQAGLSGSMTWKKYPRALLKARCISEMARTLFPDALLGASYTPEELGEEIQGHEVETRSVNVGTGEIVAPIPQMTKEPSFELEPETFWPTVDGKLLSDQDVVPRAQENNLVVGLKDLVRLQQSLNLEASQVSEIIKEITGRDRAGDCTKPELQIILQTMKDRFGK